MVPGKLRSIVQALAATALFCGLLTLGFWQLDRAAEKRHRGEDYARRFAAAPTDLTTWADYPIEELRWRRVIAEGTFSPLILLLDNRTYMGKVGFEVLSPFVLDSGARLLVDRGWVAADADRAKIPELETPDQRITITGYIGPPPVTGLKFNAMAHAVEMLAPDLARVQDVNLDTISSTFDLALEAGVIFLDRDSTGGYARDWLPPGDGSEKHRAYAVQWFAMAAILLIILVAANIRRNK